MISKDIHPVRKVFRGVMLVVLGASMMFFAGVVSLRIAYKDQALEGALQTRAFQFDIAQHRAAAYFANDQDDMLIAENLLKLSFFSPLYTHAGVKMLEDKAFDGHEPAEFRLLSIPERYKSEDYKRSVQNH